MSTLGSSGIDVFPLNLGGNTFGWTSDRATSHQVLDAFTEAAGNYSAARIQEWFEVARRHDFALPVAVQPLYNLVERAAYERDVAPVAAAENLAVLPYYSLASGFLTGKYRTTDDLASGPRGGGAKKYLTEEGLAVIKVLADVADTHGVEPATVALAWLRTRPNVAAPLASARTVDQLPALLASATLDLTPDELTALDDVSA